MNKTQEGNIYLLTNIDAYIDVKIGLKKFFVGTFSSDWAYSKF